MINRLISLLLLLAIMDYGCGNNSQSDSSGLANNSLNLTEVARNITSDAGSVSAEYQGTTNKKFVIFEENHASIKGQVEIALMLNRLNKSFGIKGIGLEGAFYSGGEIKPNWKFIDILEKEKIPIAVQLIKEGEINCAEFNSLVNPNAYVFGIEDEKEYSIQNPDEIPPVFGYFMGIIEKEIKPADLEEFAKILNVTKDTTRAYEYLINSNFFAKTYSNKLKNLNNYSIEDEIAIFKAIIDKAEEVDASIPADLKKNMDDYMSYLKTASKRSDTMINNALSETGNLGNSIALVIGAGHTKKMIELLKEKHHSYIVISPNAQKDKFENEVASLYEKKMKGLSVETGFLGLVLNNKKPPVVLNTTWLKAKANLYAATMLIAREYKEDVIKNPDVFFQKLKALESPNLSINYTSLSLTKDNEVIFEVTIKPNDASIPQSVWVKTKQIISDKEVLSSTIDEIDYRLKKALKDLEIEDGGSSRKKPPVDKGEDVKIAENKIHPETNLRKVIGNDTLAAFAKSKSEVANILLTI